MTDPTDPADAPLRPASAVRTQARNVALAGVSLIWLVPIAALAITLALAWNAYQGRGTVISVAFEDATGVTPGTTVVKFREITIGKVEAVRFTSDLTRVVLDLRIDEDVAGFIDADARFWIVRPSVSAAGVSRLDTVLTGAFVEGDWNNEVGESAPDVIAGEARPPLIRRDQAGRWVTLSAATAEGLSEGAAILHRGVPVGRMENIRLDERGDGVLIDAFIEAPHDAMLTTASVFWDASGVSLSLGAQGLSLDIQSLTSLLQGGVQFATLASGGAPVPEGQVFRLMANEAEARQSLLGGAEGEEVRLTLMLDGALRGLTAGAEVTSDGVTVGRVTDLRLALGEPAPGAGPDSPRPVLQAATIAVTPARLGLPADSPAETVYALLEAQVAEGLRARPASAGLLGTALAIELVPLADAAPAVLDRTAQPYPVLPTVAGDTDDLAASAQGLIGRLGALPLDETLRAIRDTANSFTAIATAADTRAIPADLRAVLADAQATVAELKALAEGLKTGGAVEALNATLADARLTAQSLSAASQKVAPLLDRVDALTASAQAMDLAALGTRAQEAATALRDLVASEAAQALPGRIGSAADALPEATGALKAASDEIAAFAAELRASGAAGKLGPVLDDASAAFDSLTVAAADVPAMVLDVSEASDAIEQFDFAGVSAQAKGLVEDLRAMLGTDDAEQLPKNLSDTLQAASGLLNDLRDGNAAGSLNAALGSAKVAADEVAVLARQLPQLSRRLEQLAARAEATISSYGERSAFQTETLGAIRELRRATAAFGALARTIERNPRAFILGR